MGGYMQDKERVSMGEFSTELEILQDENFAIKAPAGFKGAAWTSRSGRPGRVLYDKYSPDYISSDCYITVSTIAKDPITGEIRKRIESHLGEDGFSFEFINEGDKHIVFYAKEAELDYKTYHAFILMNEIKSIMMDVVFNGDFENSMEVAKAIVLSLRANFKEATEEELAQDAARLDAEDKADAAKAAAKEAAMKAENGGVQIAEMVEETVEEVTEEVAEEVEIAEEVAFVDEEEEIADATYEETDEEPEFDDSTEGQQKAKIYEAMKATDKITLSELQAIPEFADLGRMGTTQLMNQMMRDGIIVRIEAADNIYFALPGKAQQIQEEADAAEEAAATAALDPMEQYKIDLAKYEEDMAAYKKSKDFFGRTEMEKPVKPKKPGK